MDQISARTFYDEALKRRAWVYCGEQKKWYTPDEFINAFAKHYTCHPVFETCKVLDPRIGLGTGYQQIAVMQRKLKELSDRVEAYYKK